ncbi:hypothetical protein DCS_04677 [Drechmeria coniospora]|uniref:Autophagy-related protein 28 n=1 Tax=Drechmeria coniospora TaxID=98403 RepID=A0A151GKM7_DRECN|nr:hypothetical protein DCS_04677 [Drechmeria coniospora]KYK57665.1 hypothetical protein DCS_04677 [Drechmeria coniospora]
MMGLSFPSMLDRFAGVTSRSSPHPYPSERPSPSEHQLDQFDELDQLDPRPNYMAAYKDDTTRSRPGPTTALESKRGHSPGPWLDRPSPSSSLSKLSRPSPISESAWRGLWRREQALEQDFQQLLDLQAAGLVSGYAKQLNAGSSGGLDGHSDAGSSTPTGTFYSTTSSTSRMPKSLYLPPKSTADGNVLPVRQPTKIRSAGLRGARNGLKKTMRALIDIKLEEDAHIDAALSERKLALARVNRLGTKRTGIHKELQALDNDEHEPLGKELRELGGTVESIDRDIRLLEEKLVGMRNRRRFLKDKMDDVRSKRDAGLSGYRGALKELDAEICTLLRRPPIQPLDLDILTQSDVPSGGPNSDEGAEFLRLIPERRTMEMAKTWWESEIDTLQRRKLQIEAEQQALEDGSGVWMAVTTLVTDFEANLRTVLASGPDSSATSKIKGKEKVPALQELIRGQLPRMKEVMTELEEHMRAAEEKRWNLLICAIGAELEAFTEAYAMLGSLASDQDANASALDGTAEDSGETPYDQKNTSSVMDSPVEGEGFSRQESDNEVPPDFLISHLADSPDETHCQLQMQESDSRTTVDCRDLLEFCCFLVRVEELRFPMIVCSSRKGPRELALRSSAYPNVVAIYETKTPSTHQSACLNATKPDNGYDSSSSHLPQPNLHGGHPFRGPIAS